MAIRVPEVIGLHLCDRLDVNRETGQVSLVGLFNARHFRQFPSTVQRFDVYAALSGGQGEGTMEVVLSRLQTAEDLFVTTNAGWRFPPCGTISHFHTTVKGVAFPAPGLYVVTLRVADEVVSYRKIPVYLLEE